MSYPRAGAERLAGITGHRTLAGSQETQGLQRGAQGRAVWLAAGGAAGGQATPRVGAMNPVEKAIRKLDATQQRYRPTAFVFGVVKKYGDDNGGALAPVSYTHLTLPTTERV